MWNIFRNLFFRVSCFIRHGIKLIFVLDGRAPDVKRDAMKQRHLAGAGDGGYRSYCSVDQDRTTFNNKVLEVKQKNGNNVTISA